MKYWVCWVRAHWAHSDVQDKLTAENFEGDAKLPTLFLAYIELAGCLLRE